VTSAPSNSPKTKTIDDGTPAAVTIDSADWPYAALQMRGRVRVDHVESVAPEYRQAARPSFGDDQGEAWCDQLPPGNTPTRLTCSGVPSRHARRGGFHALLDLSRW
jgi:hypothetical protein